MSPDRDDASRPPLLVLGLGNQLLRDDGVGLVLLENLRQACAAEPRASEVEFVDGGTQGIALLGQLEARRALLLLDAAALGAAPGSVHVRRTAEDCATPRGVTAHEGNAATLLGLARLLGQLPAEVVLVGVEPELVRTGVGLSPRVRRAIGPALRAARAELERLLEGVCPPCTS